MKIEQEHIKNFVYYGAKGPAICKRNIQACYIIEIIALLLFFMFSIAIDNDNSKKTSFVLSGFLLILYVFHIAFSSIYKSDNALLFEYINNSVTTVIMTISLMAFMILVKLISGNSIYAYLIYCAIFIIFTIINIKLLIKRVHTGIFTGYLKNENSNHSNIMLKLIPLVSIAGIIIGRVSSRYSSTRVSAIILDVVFFTLLCLTSIGYGNFLKVFYIKKFNIK